MLDIKDAAIEKLKELLKEEKNGSCLRIFMAGGCCGGTTVTMDVAEKPEKEDIEVEKNGFKLYVHKDAAAQLVNATVDCDKAGGIVIRGLSKQGGGCCH